MCCAEVQGWIMERFSLLNVLCGMQHVKIPLMCCAGVQGLDSLPHSMCCAGVQGWIKVYLTFNNDIDDNNYDFPLFFFILLKVFYFPFNRLCQ